MKVMTMRTKKGLYNGLAIAILALVITACKSLQVTAKEENKTVPGNYNGSQDTTNSAQMHAKDFFKDPYLNALIDTALSNNQELNIVRQEIEIARNEVRARRGEYLPFVGAGGAAGVEKTGRYTNMGASEANIPIRPGQATPDVLPNFMVGFFATWEVDIWHKLRNARKAAFNRYLASNEGKNFLITNLVSEIAESYYELLAYDNQLEIVKQNIEIQSNALKIVRAEKEFARVTELAVRKFEAEVFHTRSLQFDIQQKIVEAENRINFLVGRFPQPVARITQDYNTLVPAAISTGVPSQLLKNRTDIKQAELELEANKLDVKSARARFYPSLNLSSGIGFQAFNPALLLRTPQSMIFSLVGQLMGPVINRNGITALYYNANAKQIQAVYHYERTILNAYIEVVNQLANINNLRQSFDLKSQQVQALNQSITISTNLFKSAKADYMEVLLTQRDALESKFDLVETKMEQMNAVVKMYRALGGGWN